MLKIIKCVVIVGNIGKSAYNKFCTVKKRWQSGQKAVAAVDGALVVVNTACTAIMLYDPWILVRPMLMIVPYAIQYIPLVGTIPLVKTIVVLGLEFIEIKS